ncbi:hypothetical protein SK128_009243 [Halocaridina rubra]|uniref:Peptidase M13 C-terminal domain-containing protein n=1 Tax=Halocaridina rubra TaxID=373956 RepID=A0AAN9AF93_HALRR
MEELELSLGMKSLMASTPMIDPVSSSGENIADNGGLRASWFAYKKHVEDNDKKDFYLPGLQNYNQDQLFFISFAKLWCMQYTPFALQYSVTNDRHPPGHFRVLGALQNSKEFSEAFRCPVGSPLNPERKCLLW